MDIKNKKKNLTKDELLVDYIKDQLEEKMQASSMDINVSCRDGSVQLSGFVDVLSEKQYAEKVARSVDSVRKVENSITIGVDSNITDKHMEKEIIDKLSESKDANRIVGVGVQVNDGVANLVGEVDTLKDAHIAMNLSAQTRGIKDVVNNTKVVTADAIDDITINNSIQQQLNESERIRAKDIVTDVKNGIVTLMGYANNRYESELAKEISMSTLGVKKVRNMISLRKNNESKQ
ncbi:BON domain-containing protein [Brassicibacter mesophilus]|uniref:BON domain-containing protein n=1 Tax=Brassicibacter mesophilus TaxID=745119 RepID=UPI003D1CB125